MMKPKIFRITLFTVFLLVLGSKNSFAQRPDMTAFNRQQNMRLANQQMQMQMTMQMMNMRHVTATTEIEYNFDVVLRDSSKINVNSVMYMDSVTQRHFLVVIDKKYRKSDTNRYKKIYPSQTLYIQCSLTANDGAYKKYKDEKNQGPIFFRGTPAPDSWMFKVISGAVNAYSYSPEVEDMNFDPTLIEAVQLNNGPILKYNQENLRRIMATDNDALEIIQKKNYYKAIKRFNQDADEASKK